MGYIRDLKGIKNKQGKTLKEHFLIRSASLDEPTVEQIKFLNEIKPKRIFDLRNEDEARNDPDFIPDGCKYYNYSLIDADLNGVVKMDRKKQLEMLTKLPPMIDCYRGMFTDDFSLKNIKKVIRSIVLEDGFPTIVHCATGKDRAGVITMILLMLLDVDYKIIVEDYLKQRPLYIKKAIVLFILAFIGSRKLSSAKKAYDYYAIKREYIDEAINTINKNFESFDSFIKNYIGLTEEDIKKFKEKALI